LPSAFRGIKGGVPRTGYAWTAVVVALVFFGFVRAQDAATEAGRLGTVLGSVLGPLLFASLIWMFVQWVIRRQPADLPIWVGVLAVGMGALATASFLGNWARETAVPEAQPMKCVPESKLYGTAPSGFQFTRLEGKDAKDAIKTINLDDPAIGHVDVAVAEGRREADIAILSSFRRTDASDDLEGFIAGAKGVGATVRREGDIAWITTTAGGTTAAAVNGCHFVMVVGDAAPVVRRLAPTVLAQ
jgi:hypothetical protein